MFHVTPATWPILTNRGPNWCPKKGKGLGRACHQDVILTSPSLHAGLSCATQSVKESRALQCRHSREGGSPEAPRIVPGHARRSLRDVDVLQQRAEEEARAGRGAQKVGGPKCCGSQALVGFTQWPRAAVAPVEAYMTLFGKEVTVVSTERLKRSPRRCGRNLSGSLAVSASVFLQSQWSGCRVSA